MIGSYLCTELAKDYMITILTRNPDRYQSSKNINYARWDGKSAIPELLEHTDAVINLLGENIGQKRWTEVQKKRIMTSRTDAATAIANSFSLCEKKPKLWIQASATGYYEQGSKETMNENSPAGSSGFLAEVCRNWEEPIKNLDIKSVRKVVIRTGVVLAPKSDLWKQISQPFQLKLGIVPGSGQNNIPWIHIEDEIRAILHVLRNESSEGIYNLAAPVTTSMLQLIQSASKAYWLKIHIPICFLQIALGKEMVKELVLTDQRVAPTKLCAEGFTFNYSSIEKAIINLMN